MKLDVTKIDGYADMSVEDKLKALEGYEFDVPPATPVDESAEVKKLKEALSKSNSEAAAYKRSLRERQSEAERQEAERIEREQAREAELNELKKKVQVSELKSQYLALGYSEELAETSAKAQAEGDIQTVLSCQTSYLAETRKNLEAAALNKQPTLSVGEAPKAMSAEERIVADAMKYAGL